MSSGGGGGQPAQQETVQKTEPWDGQKPALHNLMGLGAYVTGVPGSSLTQKEQKDAYGFGSDFTNSPSALSYYPNSTVADFSPETNLAMQLQTDRALFGSPVQNAAEQYTADTLSGKYLNAGNPYFQGMMQNVSNAITPMVDAKFEASGRYGGGAHKQALADALANAGTQAAYQNFGDERANQTRMAAFAPEIGNIDYQNIAALSDVGAARENLAQAKINEDIERYNFGQMEPYTRLGLYNNFIQGNYGGTGTAQTTGTGYQRSGSNTAGTAIAGIGTALKAFQLFSDRRLKRNIKKIGVLPNGVNLYRWTYIWGEKAVGVMADEVKKIKPSAVRNVGGYDMVDYAEVF